MKTIYLIAVLALVAGVFAVSGCTTLDSLGKDIGGLVPKTTTYNLMNLTIPTGTTTLNAQNCLVELTSIYSNITTADCTVQNVNTATSKYECVCKVKG